MKIRISWLAAGVLFCSAAGIAQTSQNAENGQRAAPQNGPSDPTHEKSSTLNNSANRASDPTQGETERVNAVPGGPATPRKYWKKGDPRGKPQHPAQARRGKRNRKSNPKATQ